MYLYQTITNKADMQDNGTFIPVFDPDHISQADRMEVWATTIKDVGDDYTLFKLMKGDQAITEKKRLGY